MERLEQLELYDIYSLWHIPFWQQTWFKIIMWALVGLVVLFLGRWVYNRFLKKKPVPISPWEKALGELKLLQQDRYETKEQGKHFYFKITDILKQYIGARFNLDTYSKTDEELVSYLQDQEILTFIKEGIKDIAQGCIYIKFANQEAMQEQINRHLNLGIQLVTETIPEK